MNGGFGWGATTSRFEKRLITALSTLLVGGCAHHPIATAPPVLMPVEVVKPVAIGCVPANMAAAPEYPDTDNALRRAPDAAGRYQLLYAGRKVRTARLNELEPVVAGCPKAATK